MCATEQTERCGPVQYLIMDFWTKGYRVPTMKQALQMEVSKFAPSKHVGGTSRSRTPIRDMTRIQGGNWSMQGFRRSGHVHDEGECQLSIAEFMAEQGPLHESDDN